MFNFANNIQFMSDKDKYVKLLTGDVEERLGRGMLSPKDFEYLHGIIASELNESVSVSTLKRLWGYSKYLSSPSVSILSILCRLVGYRDWEDYRANREKEDNAPSAIVLNDKITVATDLEVGDRIRLTWAPQRVCDIQYHGDGDFEVLASQNTGIKAGDWFCCSLIVSGEPLWLSNLRQYGKAPVAYVCGKQGGVRFEIMHNS
jgi:hypothetical protein